MSEKTNSDPSLKTYTFSIEFCGDCDSVSLLTFITLQESVLNAIPSERKRERGRDVSRSTKMAEKKWAFKTGSVSC